MSKTSTSDKILTIQVHHENLNPRTFRVPLNWIHRASWTAWLLVAISIVSTVFAVREYVSERTARPELVSELENEVQELKIALEKKNTVSLTSTPSHTTDPVATSATNDPKAVDVKPSPGAGTPLEGKDGIWANLAEGISIPASGQSSVRLEDARVEWQGKYANFVANVAYKDPGKGTQQGHIVALGRANDRIFAHPEGVLNTGMASYLFHPNRGEYFSVARFRILKARFGPFDNPKQLSEIQIFLFDTNNKLILNQTFKYGK